MNTRGKNNIWSLYLAQYLWFPNTLKAYSCLLCSFTCVDSFFIMICQSPIVHTVPQQYALSFFNWCPGGCCHIITIFRCSSNLLRWCVVFQQYDFFFSSFVSSVEERFAVIFDSWTRIDCNLISCSVFYTLAASWISNILDGWLPKNVSCQASVRIWKSGKNFSTEILKFCFWSLNYDFFSFHNLNLGRKDSSISFYV